MFNNVVIGVKELEAARDALRLAESLASAEARLTLAHVQVVAPRPAPDSGAAGAAVRRRSELESLAALREEARIDAELAYVEARSVRQGLHDTARARGADLLVISASRDDVIYRDLVGDDAHEVLEDAPCAVAEAPVGYSGKQDPLRAIGVASDGSSQDARALAVAKELVAHSHAELSIFHVASGVHGDFGDPAQELARHGQSVDLLVLTTRRDGRITRFLGQGTVRQLADEPPCPLLVLAAEEASADHHLHEVAAMIQHARGEGPPAPQRGAGASTSSISR